MHKYGRKKKTLKVKNIESAINAASAEDLHV
jgi:hypothetical protein